MFFVLILSDFSEKNSFDVTTSCLQSGRYLRACPFNMSCAHFLKYPRNWHFEGCLDLLIGLSTTLLIATGLDQGKKTPLHPKYIRDSVCKFIHCTIIFWIVSC